MTEFPFQSPTRIALMADGREYPMRGVGDNGRLTMTQVFGVILHVMVDTVDLRDAHSHVMLVDDQGHSKGLPVNERATAIYHTLCRPGTTHVIRGNVVICPDSDFEE